MVCMGADGGSGPERKGWDGKDRKMLLALHHRLKTIRVSYDQRPMTQIVYFFFRKH